MTIIIPAYRPDEKLLRLLADLRARTDASILVVNAGSGKEYDALFEKAASLCDTLLVHEENRGKGAALKTAYSHILDQGGESGAVCAADADGQHLPEDILRCLEKAEQNPGSLVLGTRKFSGEVPARSRFGNTVTRHTFHFLMGKKIYDTQTGLRAFTVDLIPMALAIGEDRYEYEMQMLCDAVRKKIPILEVEIRTVYLEDNRSSHFHPLRDAMKVYGLLLRCAMGPLFEGISFILSSCFAFLVDVTTYYLLFRFVFPLFSQNTRLIAFFALLTARIVSSLVNFLVNRSMIFHNKEKPVRSYLLYLVLVGVIFLVNDKLNALLLIRAGLHPILCHVLSQTICFPLSFFAQKFIVFSKRKRSQ